MVYLSIIIPAMNEEENIPLLRDAVNEALRSYVRPYELLIVDDGSTDATFAVAAALARSDPRLRVIKFRKNYGQTAAMAAGIRFARGEILVTMDGDLQNDPADIVRLVALVEGGYDIATGWRRKRRDGAGRVFLSQLANRIMATILGVYVRDSGCSLKAFRAQLIKQLPMYGEMHRFIPALSGLAGARLAQIEVNHHPRRFGLSKYGFSRIYKVMLDIVSIRLLLSYVRRPMAWHAPLTALAILFGLMAEVAAFVVGTRVSLPFVTVGVLWFSLAMFLTGWGIFGQMLASMNPRASSYATLGAALSAGTGELGGADDGPRNHCQS